MNYRSFLWLGLLASLLTSCQKEKEDSSDAARAANAFLRAVHQQNCKEAFTFFSNASQEIIRKESAEAIKGAPYYAQQFSPENLYCMSTYANRYLSFVKGSATAKKVQGTNVVLEAKLREGTDFLIPGFFPMSHTNIPVPMHMVKENGAWKIDLLAPRLARQNEIREREQSAEKRVENYRAEQEKTRFEIQQTCPANLALLARWTFTTGAATNVVPDETGRFEARLSGAKIVSSPDDAGLHFEKETDTATLPEALLKDRPCGVIAFWLRKDSPGRHDKILTRVSAPRDLTIATRPNGRINFNMPGQSIECRASLEAGKFYHVALVWNDEGEKVYIDGNCEIHGRQVAILRSAGAIELGGSEGFRQKNSDPRMTIRDLQFWEGKASDADIRKIFDDSK